MKLTLAKTSNFGVVECGFWTDENNEVWMTREQVANALEYTSADAIRKIHERNRDRLDKNSVTVKLSGTDGKLYNTYVYNQKGLYEICRFSRQPKADAFLDWAWEVIESIRKHGMYATPQTLEAMLQDPDTMIKILQALKAEREQRQALERKVEQDKPRVLFSQAVEASDSSILIGDLAKILRQNGIEVGQNRLFQWMRDNGYLIKSGSSRNMPTQYSMERGWFEIQERVIQVPDREPRVARTPKVTGKGQLYFVNRFISDYGKAQ